MTRPGVLAAVVAAVAALTGGWPLLNAAVGDALDRQRLAAGEVLLLGGGDYSARLTVGRGWTMRKSASNSAQGYTLTRGAVELRVNRLVPAGRPTLRQLWGGLREVLRTGDPGAALGGPRPAGDGLAGPAARNGMTGTLTVRFAPDRRTAVSTTALGGRGAAARDRAAAGRVVESLTFVRGSR
ncbi:hypothetical protein ACIBF1_36805 [Spirillospora sp. NPDC050679]